jgi:heavy metal translocating P-type ATPase
MLTRLGVAIFLTRGVMVYSISMFGHEVYDVQLKTETEFAKNFTGLVRHFSMLLSLVVFTLLGVPVFASAIGQLRRRIASTDFLVMSGVTAALAYSAWMTFTGGQKTYFETACMILVLLTGGRYLEAVGKIKASEAIASLDALWPTEARIIRDGAEMTTPVAEVCRGDLMLVAAGERIAADGTIEDGEGHVDEQLVTGESVPVPRRPGDVVRAGTLSVDGALRVRATAVGAESTLGRLISLLNHAKTAKGRYERLSDRAAGWLIVVTIVMSCLGAWLGWMRGGFGEAVMTALAVMLIACPCALGIATPMALWIALGRAASAGVLFRSGEAIEALARVKALCFDKTGTLTSGRPEVSRFVTRANEPAAVLSRSVAAFAADRRIAPAKISQSRTIPGRGMVGLSAATPVSLGSIAHMDESSMHFDDHMRSETLRLVASGQGIACVGWDRQVSGVFAFSEILRPEARRAIDELRAMGLHLTVLTGDHRRRGEVIAEQLGVATLAELTPDRKIAQVRRLREELGLIAMVGDGLNDAPALAAADIGVAMGCGADVTRESADVCLLGDDLRTLPWAIRLAAAAVKTIRRNLFWALFYNVAGISLALAGVLSPIFSALAMVVSSLLVVANSLRLSRRISQGVPGGTEHAGDPAAPDVKAVPTLARAST